MKLVSPESVGLDSSVLENVRSYLDETYVKDGKYIGTITLVARNGKVAYLDSLGLMDRENKKPMQEDAIFRIYSMTKAITSISIMQLYEKSKFRLDDPVHWYIPSWKKLRVYESGIYPNFLTSRPKRHMTIRDLLSHMSGLTYDFMYRTNVDAAYRKTKVQQANNLQEFVDILSELPLEFSPGDKWNYSVATDVLGHLIEVMSGMPLDEYFEKNIFGPLDMVDTGFSCPEDKLDRLASLYEHNPKGEPRLLEIPFLNTKMFSDGICYIIDLKKYAVYKNISNLALVNIELNITGLNIKEIDANIEDPNQMYYGKRLFDLQGDKIFYKSNCRYWR